MKTIDLSKGKYSVADILALAKSDTVLIHSDSGEDFLVEPADEFDREVLALGSSDKFMAFLHARSRETGDITLQEARKKRGL